MERRLDTSNVGGKQEKRDKLEIAYETPALCVNCTYVIPPSHMGTILTPPSLHPLAHTGTVTEFVM